MLELHASFSALKKADLCLFAWYADKVQAQIEEGPPSRGVQIGSSCHKELEVFEEEYELSPLAKVAWDLVPTALDWERELSLQNIDLGLALPFWGTIDLYSESLSMILDYKFSSNPERWLPDTAKIGFDRQLLLYAALIREVKGALPAVVGQIQVNYNSGRANLRTAPCSSEAVAEALTWAKNLSVHMRRCLQLKAWEVPTVGRPGVADACWAYRVRCPAYAYCVRVEENIVHPRHARATGWEV